MDYKKRLRIIRYSNEYKIKLSKKYNAHDYASKLIILIRNKNDKKTLLKDLCRIYII